MDAIKDQSIPIEPAVNRSRSKSELNEDLPQTQIQHGHNQFSLQSDKSVKEVTPPLPEKSVSQTKQNVAMTNTTPNQKISRSQFQSSPNLSKTKFHDIGDNIDDFGFPIKEGFRHKAFNDQFVISYTVTSGKISKLQVSNAANGQMVIDTNLSRWDDKK